MPMPKIKEIAEVVKTNMRTSGGLVDFPNNKLKITAAKVTQPITISIRPKMMIPKFLGMVLVAPTG